MKAVDTGLKKLCAMHWEKGKKCDLKEIFAVLGHGYFCLLKPFLIPKHR
jgi:hypothetical protein